ncbi:uncharacterized protein LOC132036628 [Lycium ferocissimum]|uniref:uncharacterized protein LOC132036628 n=1 Tax=Lycium ferocissimum TaxID=112874 RepID=UPI002814A8C0|nr:uncharacterized protein LOC132036628 [Lycium ferocissimum]
MHFFQVPSKTQYSSNISIKNLIIVLTCFGCMIYLVCSIYLAPNNTNHFHTSVSLQDDNLTSQTNLDHIVFGIASNELSWSKRKEYVKLWWKPNMMRGCVFLEKMPPSSSNGTKDESLPPICISGDTSNFRYTYKGGTPSAIRVARVVSETVALNHSNVRWFVFGDDDTIFFPENLVKTLSKYDHGLWYYIGTNSESFTQNKFFSYEMAFGGAGFAISYPLANVLARFFDSCIERYPHLYGSDGRVHACLAELGVGLTREPGFHQMDFHGNVFGLLAAHPNRPLVSMHHMEAIDPIFPNMTTVKALEHLYNAANFDPHRILQQTVCYDRWFSWTVSVSWGYAVQVFDKHVPLPNVERVEESYAPWKRSHTGALYDFDSRKYESDPCRRQLVYFLDRISSETNRTKAIYKRKTSEECKFDMSSPRRLEEIRVLSSKLVLDKQQLLAPRRHCCDVLTSTWGNVMEIAIRECKEDELIYLQH